MKISIYIANPVDFLNPATPCFSKGFIAYPAPVEEWLVEGYLHVGDLDVTLTPEQIDTLRTSAFGKIGETEEKLRQEMRERLATLDDIRKNLLALPNSGENE